MKQCIENMMFPLYIITNTKTGNENECTNGLVANKELCGIIIESAKCLAVCLNIFIQTF